MSDFVKAWPLGFATGHSPDPGHCGVQKSRGLAVLVGTPG